VLLLLSFPSKRIPETVLREIAVFRALPPAYDPAERALTLINQAYFKFVARGMEKNRQAELKPRLPVLLNLFRLPDHKPRLSRRGFADMPVEPAGSGPAVEWESNHTLEEKISGYMSESPCPASYGVDFGDVINRFARIQVCQDPLSETGRRQAIAVSPGELMRAWGRAGDNIEIEMVSHGAGAEAI